MTLYKAVRIDGTSFHDPTFRWVPATGDPVGTVVTHPNFSATGKADGYLSVSTEPADCMGMEWPCRLLTVEPVGDVLPDPRGEYPHKRVGAAFRVTGERPAHEALGPNGAQVAAFLTLLPTLTSEQRAAAWAAAWGAAWAAARDAARALVVRDLITPDQFATLTAPMRTAGVDFDHLTGVAL